MPALQESTFLWESLYPFIPRKLLVGRVNVVWLKGPGITFVCG